MTSVSTHVLDAAAGGPRSGVVVRLTTVADVTVAEATTDASGRVPLLADALAPGRYRISWRLAPPGGTAFLHEVCVVVDLGEDRHYHVPLLAAPASAVAYLGA